MRVVEKTYGHIFRFALMVMNPFKKAIITTECKVHQFINIQALEILKNDGFYDAYVLFNDYIFELNRGAVWADQDFKSIGHFYNPERKKGLYGHYDALGLAQQYYKRAKDYLEINDLGQAMFYIGAVAHLIQDMTIPQHANIRLLDNHHQYEVFVQKVYDEVELFKAIENGVYLSSIEEFMEYNTKIAIKIYKKFHCVEENRKKFFCITKYTLPLAEKTTAGCLLLFYKDMGKRA